MYSMDDLNLYMEENHVPTELRIRLREYFMYAKAMNRQEYYSKLYDKMSPSLRGEVVSTFVCVCACVVVVVLLGCLTCVFLFSC